jgi:hypothetical protein
MLLCANQRISHSLALSQKFVLLVFDAATSCIKARIERSHILATVIPNSGSRLRLSLQAGTI